MSNCIRILLIFFSISKGSYLLTKSIRKSTLPLTRGEYEDVGSKIKDVLKNLTQNSGMDRVESDKWEMLCETFFSHS